MPHPPRMRSGPRCSFPGSRGQADDCTRLLGHHRPAGGARAQEGRSQVEPDRGVPVLCRHLPDPGIARATDIIHQDVEPAVLRDNSRKCVSDRLLLRDVGHDRRQPRGLCPQLTRGPLELPAIHVDQDQHRALLGKSPGYCCPDAMCRPRDGDDLVLHPAHGGTPQRVARLVTAPPVAVRPPSTTYCAPVVLAARSEQRNRTVFAISSGVV